MVKQHVIPKGKESKERGGLMQGDTWKGLPAALAFARKTKDPNNLRKEYDYLKSIDCNKECKAFDLNKNRCRPMSRKIYDLNRVKLKDVENDFIHATSITLKEMKEKIIMAQLPQTQDELFVENFWKMIYDEEVSILFLITTEDVFKDVTCLFKKKQWRVHQQTVHEAQHSEIRRAAGSEGFHS